LYLARLPMGNARERILCGVFSVISQDSISSQHGQCTALCLAGTGAERAQWAEQRGGAWGIARSGRRPRLCEFPGCHLPC